MTEPTNDGWIYVDYWPAGDEDLPPVEICLGPAETINRQGETDEEN